MVRFWKFIRNEGNRQRLAWLGSGAVVIAAGFWTAFVYFYPSKPAPAPGDAKPVANCGGIAIGGNVSGSTISAGSPTNVDCAVKPN